jgi:ATP-dependent helicase/nuclease subunit A
MREPNPEQKAAIEHRGGVLLQAGAGAGKTFVLIEHIKYLVGQWIEEFKLTGNDNILFKSFLKSQFNKIVLMTFTKKAAGEISIRLFDEFQEMKKNAAESKQYWEIAVELVDSITVSTIHGFCFKLIKQGFFKDVDAQDEMLDDIQFKLIIEELFDSWIEKKLEDDQTERGLVDFMLKDRNQIIRSLLEIISDPSLRILWQDLDLSSLQEREENQIWRTLFNELGANDLFDRHIDQASLEEFKGKKWCDFLVSFEEQKIGKIHNRESVNHYIQFFKALGYKIPVKPRAAGVKEEIKDYYSSIKILADFVKKYGEDFENYIDHYDTVVTRWFALFQNLVQFVDNEYAKRPGLTFADLEYLVWQGLKDQNTAERIAESYNYFIIDEFQDTSYVQYEIVKELIRNDFNRLFCVGDVKQAIYGFRGGELRVFNECKDNMIAENRLSLKNNYRSLPDIIHFNNNIFEFLFSRGLGYEGQDPHSVEVEYQVPGINDKGDGKVYPLLMELEDETLFAEDNKVSNREVEYLEALRIVEEVKSLRSKYPNEKVAMLYKRLKPSIILINLLMDEGIGFTAQVKVPYANDPILGIFQTLIQRRFDKNPKTTEFTIFLLNNYLQLLGGAPRGDVADLIETFEQKTLYYGLFQSFMELLGELGIANSNYSNNLKYIQSLISLSAGDWRYLYLLLDEGGDNAYSLSFQYGNDSDKVITMSAHASKGLEFDHVILGGIYTNDARMPITPMFGKLPLSLQWSLELEGKKRFKTPQYVFEQDLTKRKDFSESKRLFYVACTRAEKSLSWVQLDLSKLKMRTQKGSWGSGFNIWQDEVESKLVLERTLGGADNKKACYNERYLQRMEQQPPLFHIDSLGNYADKTDKKIMAISELSVTRLATIVDCPRKFYLKNICKLTEEDLDLESAKNTYVPESLEEELSSKSFSSSAERGSLIHEKLSEIIIGEFKADIEIADQIKKPINWVVENLKSYVENFEFVSEKAIKFDIYGHMVSGIPDLYLKNKQNGQLSEIWDFKTGQRGESKEKPYWFQLYCYAHAAYELNLVERENSIKLVLCYADNELIVDKNVSFNDVENYLFEYWCQLNRPDIINPDHCYQCLYNDICQK